MAPLLAVRDLHAGYGTSPVLFGVTLMIERGEVLTLLGRNGMGKTTTVRAILGLLRPSQGEILLRGQPQQNRPRHLIARAGIGLVPEGRQIFRPAAAAAAPPGRSPASTPSSPSCASAVATSATSSRAASSRCWRSAAR